MPDPGGGPIFGGWDLAIYDNCNSKQSCSNFPLSYGKNEGAQSYELTKTYKFTVKRY
jgi:hypothetical protein